MAEPLIIQLIADYGIGDPAFAEVIQKFTHLDRSIRVHEMSVPPFSTVATGMWIAQFATVNAFPGLIIFSNTAPRIKNTEEGGNVLGGQLTYAEVNNGVVVVAVNTGYCLSFIKKKISKLLTVNVPNVGSQFRSRDYYPDAVVGLTHGEKKYLGEEIPRATIPEPPGNLIGFIDGYGNLKTTQRRSQHTLSAGTKTKIVVGEVERTGVVVDETYQVEDEQISFAPGSTGGEDRFMEIWVRGGSAWEAFGRPKVETPFHIESLA